MNRFNANRLTSLVADLCTPARAGGQGEGEGDGSPLGA